MITLTLRRAARTLWSLFVRAEHLSDSEIAGFLDNDLTAEERTAVEAHLEGCRECRGATADVSRLSRGYSAATSETPVVAVGSRKTTRIIPIAVASLVAAASVLFMLRPSSSTVDETSSPVRAATGANADARPSIEIVAPSQEHAVEQATGLLTWRSTGADFYRVSVSDDSGAPVVVRETSDTTLALSSMPSLDASRLYLWHVDAIAGGRVASSGVRRLRLIK